MDVCFHYYLMDYNSLYSLKVYLLFLLYLTIIKGGTGLVWSFKKVKGSSESNYWVSKQCKLDELLTGIN